METIRTYESHIERVKSLFRKHKPLRLETNDNICVHSSACRGYWLVLMCVKRKPRVVPTVTQQISTISRGYREFGNTVLSKPATPQKISPRDENMNVVNFVLPQWL